MPLTTVGSVNTVYQCVRACAHTHTHSLSLFLLYAFMLWCLIKLTDNVSVNCVSQVCIYNVKNVGVHQCVLFKQR
jgi:hypothetical protein